MNKNDLIKWVLIAGAAYLVYRWLQQQNTAGQTVEQIETPPVDSKTVAPPATTTGVTAASIANSLTAVPGFAFFGTNGEAGATTQNGHHWNFYWKHSALYNGRDAGPAEVGAGEDEQLGLSDYAQRVYNLFFAAPASNLGLLMRLPPPAFAAAWRM